MKVREKPLLALYACLCPDFDVVHRDHTYETQYAAVVAPEKAGRVPSPPGLAGSLLQEGDSPEDAEPSRHAMTP